MNNEAKYDESPESYLVLMQRGRKSPIQFDNTHEKLPLHTAYSIHITVYTKLILKLLQEEFKVELRLIFS